MVLLLLLNWVVECLAAAPAAVVQVLQSLQQIMPRSVMQNRSTW
jgi:hypothetical protein